MMVSNNVLIRKHRIKRLIGTCPFNGDIACMRVKQLKEMVGIACGLCAYGEKEK